MVTKGFIPGSALRDHSGNAWGTIWHAGVEPRPVACKADVLPATLVLPLQASVFSWLAMCPGRLFVTVDVLQNGVTLCRDTNLLLPPRSR